MKPAFLLFISIGLLFSFEPTYAQNPLAIPTALTGTSFDLNVQNGVTQFFPGINTPTFGVNGALLGPTLIVNKGDWVTFNVTNSLTGTGNSTTMHWHGMHVPAEDDGGPHQIIEQGATWSPQFQILNNAGTFWYHPHGAGKTDLQVSKGIAGMIIVRDSEEGALILPRTYGVDDFPVVVQTKAFDILNQIAIATNDDTLICVNGTVDPFLDAPAQIIRLRLLNGSSMRVYNFGFTDNMPFTMISSDGGLLNTAISLSRIRLAPGERAEILLDLQGMEGQSFYLNAFNSELVNGIYGAATVTGMMGGEIPGYNLNPLNGADFRVLEINVGAQTASPVTSLPGALSINTPWTDIDTIRTFDLLPDVMMDPDAQVEGPFNINGLHFNMDIINVTTYLNNTEKWHISNNTGIAHPFHIHDVEFFIDNINGGPVPDYMQGKKDVVLVMPQQYVEVIMKFEDYADDSIPYMYHCHMLHHEDDGMMGSFRVIDTAKNALEEITWKDISVYPNPVSELLSIEFNNLITDGDMCLINTLGQTVVMENINYVTAISVPLYGLPAGIYFLQVRSGNKFTVAKIIIQ